MQLHLSKAIPVSRRHDGCVVGWICTIHATFDGGSGFDDLKFQVPAGEHRPLNQWTTAQMHDFLVRECPLSESFRRFVGFMNYRRDYTIGSECALLQLGDDAHVQLPSIELHQ